MFTSGPHAPYERRHVVLSAVSLAFVYTSPASVPGEAGSRRHIRGGWVADWTDWLTGQLIFILLKFLLISLFFNN